MDVVFWAAVGVVVYVYAGYPMVLAAWARLSPRPVRRDASVLPSVSIVVAARNEGERLPGRLANLLALDYPPERVEIIVVSDGSTDRTREVMASFAAGHGTTTPIRFIDRRPGGKAAALNTGVAAATHEVLVFADARQRFARDAVRQLVAPLADASVAAVSGELVLDAEAGGSDSSIGDGVGAYWRYEKWMRKRESTVHSMLGATGAIYAMRRSCWSALPEGTILDDVLAPMRAVLGGRRVVFEPRARAFDVAAPDAAAEWRRKTRTLAGNYQALALEPRLLLPIVNPVWLQYVSHKLGRLAVPWALLAAFVASAMLARGSAVYLAAFAAQLVFYGLAGYGFALERRAAGAAVQAAASTSREKSREAVNA